MSQTHGDIGINLRQSLPSESPPSGEDRQGSELSSDSRSGRPDLLFSLSGGGLGGLGWDSYHRLGSGTGESCSSSERVSGPDMLLSLPELG